MIKFFLILLLSTNLAFSQSAYRIQKGESSPISGVVITDSLAKHLYKQEQKVTILEDLRLTNKELLDVYMKQNIQLKENANKAKYEAFWYKVGLGVISGLLIYRGITK